MSFLLSILLTFPLFAAVRVDKISVTNTQAVIEYTAPDEQACTLKVADLNLGTPISSAVGNGTSVTVTTRGLQAQAYAGQVVYLEGAGSGWHSSWSGWQTVDTAASNGLTFTFLNANSGTFTANGTTVPWGNVGALINDVNTALFSGSNLDSRAGNLSRGRSRTFVLGDRIKVETGVDGRNYSRALHALSRHVGSLACAGGSDVSADFFFNTGNIPLGNAAMVDWNGSRDAGGVYKLPYFDVRGQREKPSGVAVDRVIEPGSGMLFSLGQIRQEAIDTEDLAITSSNATTMPTSAANWTNQGNMLSNTDSSAYAKYQGITQDIVCVKPNIVHSHQNDEYGYASYTRIQPKYTDSFQWTFKGAYAVTGSGSDRDLEVAMRFDGVCDATSPWTQWQTVPLTNNSSPADVLFPAATIPKAAFGDWITAGTQVPSKVQAVTYKNNVLVSDGSATVTFPDAASTGYWSHFKDHWKYSSGTTGTPIIIGGDLATCTGGTTYYAQTFNNPKSITLNTTVAAGSGQNVCAPQAVLMIRKKTTSNDEIRIQYVNGVLWESWSAGGDSSGSRKRTSFLPVPDQNGNEGFIWQAGTQGHYWVSSDNMESRRFMGNWIPSSPGNWDSGPCNVDGISSSNTDPYSFTCTAVLGGVTNVPVRITIHDTSSTKFAANPTIGIGMYPLCTGEGVPDKCITVTKILGDGTYSLGDLMQAKFPAFDKTKFTVCTLQEPEGSKAPVRCLVSGQDTIAWLGVWDFDKLISNYNPSDQTTNPIIAGISPARMNYGVMHFNQLINTQSMQVSPKQGRVDGSAGDGPFILRTGDGVSSTPTDRAVNSTTDVRDCTSGETALYGHLKCTDLIFTSEPFDPDPISPSTGAAGEYGAFTVGQTLEGAKCNTLQAPLPSPNEYPGCLAVTADATASYCFNLEKCARRTEAVQILSRTGTAPNIQVVIGRQMAAVGPMVDLASGTRWFTGGAGGVRPPLAAGFAVWDFITSPDASNPAAFQGTLYSSDHGSCADRGCVAPTEVGIQIHTSPSAAALAGLGDKWARDAYSHFNYKGGLRYSNVAENYVTGPIVYGSTSDPTLKFALNARPLFRQQQVENIWGKIGGTSFLYKTPRTFGLNYKGLPYMAYSNNHPIKETSAVTLADTTGDNYKFCIALHADECKSGSKPHEMYANVPFVNPIDSTGYANCPNMEYREDNSICTAITHWSTNQGVEYHYGFSDDMGNGAQFRKIGGWFIRNTRGGTFNNPKVFSNGRMYGPLTSHWGLDYGDGTFFAKIPKVAAPDGIDRRFWVPIPVSVGSTPTGTVVMQVEFGYQELSDLSTGTLRCMPRNEACYATSKQIPLPYGPGDGTDTATGYANYFGGYYTPTAINPVTFTIPAGHGLANDSRVFVYALGGPQDITVISATQFSINGSTTTPGTGGETYIYFERQDSPFLFSGDGCTVSTASNTTPIRIQCTTEHKLQSGNRVFITGVSGNTNANGHFTVRWTGNSTLDLYDNSGNAIAGSGSGTGGTLVPGGQGCDSGCTVTIPALSNRVMWYRKRYLNASGAVIFMTPLQAIATP